ncbi:3D domain-containing protein [bacterium]|nr:3D domain-containing protein [bacterium]
MMLITGILLSLFFYIPIESDALAEVKSTSASNSIEDKQSFQDLQISQGVTILPCSPLPDIKVIRKIKVIVTAYSSSACETQGNPFITASGERVHDGIVANNMLPFGTKIRIPDIFGDKIFSVADRMNAKKGDYHVDVWFASREQALNFGAKKTTIEVVD